MKKADVAKRVVAFCVDMVWIGGAYLVLLAVLSFVPFFGMAVAWLAAVLLFLGRDALPSTKLIGSSPGKRLAGLVTMGLYGKPCTLEESTKRNLPLAVPLMVSSLFQMLPIFGAFLSGLVASAILILILGTECYKLFEDPRGRRIGDILAGTQVVEKGSY